MGREKRGDRLAPPTSGKCPCQKPSGASPKLPPQVSTQQLLGGTRPSVAEAKDRKPLTLFQHSGKPDTARGGTTQRRLAGPLGTFRISSLPHPHIRLELGASQARGDTSRCLRQRPRSPWSRRSWTPCSGGQGRGGRAKPVGSVQASWPPLQGTAQQLPVPLTSPRNKATPRGRGEEGGFPDQSK